MRKTWALPVAGIFLAFLFSGGAHGAAVAADDIDHSTPVGADDEVTALINQYGLNEVVDAPASPASTRAAEETWQRTIEELCSDWERLADAADVKFFGCLLPDATDGPTTADYVQAAQQAFATLVIEPLPIHQQPGLLTDTRRSALSAPPIGSRRRCPQIEAGPWPGPYPSGYRDMQTGRTQRRQHER